MKTLAGKLALVTGASGEIGAAVALRLAADGAFVLAHYGTNRDGAEAVVRQIIASDGEAEAVGSDLSAPDGARALFDRADTVFGGRHAGHLDVLVNNAGTFAFGSLEDSSDDDFDRVFAINVRAPFQLAREAVRRMSATGWGRIVNVGSVFGQAAPAAGMSLYCGPKFALAGMTRAWSRDVVSVDRFGRGRDVAEAVAYLASPAASHINGVCLNVDGGWSA